MRVSGVDLAGILLLVIGSVAIGYLAGQQSQHREKTTRAYCESKLRAIGYEPAGRATNDAQDKGNKDAIDVCQQIRSAEAAEDSAAYALVGVGLAALAFFAALAAARFTWKQADSAAEQVAIMRNEQRPWVVINSLTTGVVHFSENIKFAMHAHIDNASACIATDVRMKFLFVYQNRRPIEDVVNDLIAARNGGDFMILEESRTILPARPDQFGATVTRPWVGDKTGASLHVLAVVDYGIRDANKRGSTGRHFIGSIIRSYSETDGIRFVPFNDSRTNWIE